MFQLFTVFSLLHEFSWIFFIYDQVLPFFVLGEGNMGKEDEAGERGTPGTSEEFGARQRCSKCSFSPSSIYIYT